MPDTDAALTQYQAPQESPDNQDSQEESTDLTAGLTLKAKAFLAAYAECGNTRLAAKAAGVNQRTHWYWLEKVPAYRVAFAQAQREAAAILEHEARRRAVEGVRRYRFTKDGQPILRPGASPDDPDPYYYDLEYSDRLLEVLLRAKLPDEYGHKTQTILSGPGGGPVEVSHSLRQIALLNEEICNQLTDALEQAADIGDDQTD